MMSPDGNASDPAQPLRVLIVEDNVEICDLFRVWLQEDYDVDVAYDGESALEQFDTDVDVLLLDRRMPNTSGDDVLTAVRERGWDGQVIMVTGIEPSTDVIWMEFDDYLMKPIDREELLAAVEKQSRIRALEADLQEYLGLVAKLAAIQQTRAPTTDDAERQDEYEALLDRINELEDKLQPKLESLPEEDIIATGIRDLWYDSGNRVAQ